MLRYCNTKAYQYTNGGVSAVVRVLQFKKPWKSGFTPIRRIQIWKIETSLKWVAMKGRDAEYGHSTV
jgi:hypothetical protein